MSDEGILEVVLKCEKLVHLEVWNCRLGAEFVFFSLFLFLSFFLYFFGFGFGFGFGFDLI